jgi:hypothetical protein
MPPRPRIAQMDNADSMRLSGATPVSALFMHLDRAGRV